MDRHQLRQTLLDVLEQETWERPENLADDVKIREGLKLDSVDLLSVMLRVETQLLLRRKSRRTQTWPTARTHRRPRAG